MSPQYLGEFEQMVLLSVLRLGEGAYGLSIGDELDAVTGREVSSGALYTTLDRLEDKGLLSSRTADPSESRRGRPRRYFAVTEQGVTALRQSRRALHELWDGLGPVLDES